MIWALRAIEPDHSISRSDSLKSPGLRPGSLPVPETMYSKLVVLQGAVITPTSPLAALGAQEVLELGMVERPKPLRKSFRSAR
jgi:hypothetical protein